MNTYLFSNDYKNGCIPVIIYAEFESKQNLKICVSPHLKDTNITDLSNERPDNTFIPKKWSLIDL